MPGLPQPSESALNRARALGASLASRCDRTALSGIADSYCLYDSFQRDYRYQIEQMPVFWSYERSLRSLAVQEGRRNYLVADDPRYRIALSLCMLLPLKEAFWDAWEQHLQVNALFCEQRSYTSSKAHHLPEGEVRHIGARLARVAAKRDSQQTAKQWEQFASRLFAPESIEGDALWQVFTSNTPAADLRQTGT